MTFRKGGKSVQAITLVYNILCSLLFLTALVVRGSASLVDARAREWHDTGQKRYRMA